jgi:hypothetical protein
VLKSAQAGVIPARQVSVKAYAASNECLHLATKYPSGITKLECLFRKFKESGLYSNNIGFPKKASSSLQNKEHHQPCWI